MIAYKVVREENKKLYSCIVTDKNQRVRYYKTKWTEEGRLCCFKTYKDAVMFISYIRSINPLIYKCEVVLAKGRRPKRRELLNGVDNKRHILNLFSDQNWPEGTIFCSRVKLLEKVY